LCKIENANRTFFSRAAARPRRSYPTIAAGRHSKRASSQRRRELREPSQYYAVEGLTCERREGRTGAVVERHEAGRLQLPYRRCPIVFGCHARMNVRQHRQGGHEQEQSMQQAGTEPQPPREGAQGGEQEEIEER